jgi:hypothetical protein
MIENGLILTGSDAELLSRALSEGKTKGYAESQTSLFDTQALDALVSCFRTMEKDGQEDSQSTQCTGLGEARGIYGSARTG